MSEKLEESDSH